MKHSVKFKAITYKGDVVNKTVKVDGPEFNQYVEDLVINGTTFSFVVSLEDQVMEWLDNSDKMDIMEQNGWYTILDYSVRKKIPKQTKAEKLEEFKGLVEKYFNPNSETSVKLRDDFMVTYIKMFDKIQKLSAEQQFIIVLGTVDVAYTAQSEAYKHAITLIQSIGDRDIAKRVSDQDKEF